MRARWLPLVFLAVPLILYGETLWISFHESLGPYHYGPYSYIPFLPLAKCVHVLDVPQVGHACGVWEENIPIGVPEGLETYETAVTYLFKDKH